MKSLKLVLPLIALAAATAHAGHEVRNGGSAVVCYEADGTTMKSVELFDYWEMARKTGQQVDLGAESLAVADKIELFTDRLLQVDPYRAKRYRQAALSILAQVPAILHDDLDKTPIANDLAPETPAAPCQKELFAVQIRDPLPGEARFLIRRDLWDIADNTTRAGIVLHEAIYRETIETGKTDSSAARLLNFKIAMGDDAFITDNYPIWLKQAGLTYRETFPHRLKREGAVIFLDRDCSSAKISDFCYGNLVWPTSVSWTPLQAAWDEQNPPNVGWGDGSPWIMSFDPTAAVDARIHGEKLRLKPCPTENNSECGSDSAGPGRIVVEMRNERVTGADIRDYVEPPLRVKRSRSDEIACKNWIRLGADGYLNSCFAATGSFTLGSKHNLIMSDGVVVFDERTGNLRAARLRAPTLLPLYGFAKELAVTGATSFSENEQVWGGHLANDRRLIVGGQTLYVRDFDVHGRKFRVDVPNVTFANPTFQGLRIGFDSYSDQTMRRMFCNDLGFYVAAPLLGGPLGGTHKDVFFAGKAKIYDPATRTSRDLVDQSWPTYTSLSCAGPLIIQP